MRRLSPAPREDPAAPHSSTLCSWLCQVQGPLAPLGGGEAAELLRLRPPSPPAPQQQSQACGPGGLGWGAADMGLAGACRALHGLPEDTVVIIN